MINEKQGQHPIPKTSGSLVSVEGQTNEGLWAVVQVCGGWNIDFGNSRAIWTDNQSLAYAVVAAHNASLTKRQQPSQTDEEIAKEAAETILYRHGDAQCKPACIPSLTAIILAALRAKSSSVSGLRMFHKWASNELETQARTILELVAKSEKLPGKKEAPSDDVNHVLQKTLNLLLRYCGWDKNFAPDGTELPMSRPRDVQRVEKLCQVILSPAGDSSPATSVPASPPPVPSESEKPSRDVEDFIRNHHNPIVAQKNAEIEDLHLRLEAAAITFAESEKDAERFREALRKIDAEHPLNTRGERCPDLNCWQCKIWQIAHDALMHPEDTERKSSEEKDALADWLKPQCSRLMYGQCSTTRCLWRGGWKPGPSTNYDLATCEPYELSVLLGGGSSGVSVSSPTLSAPSTSSKEKE